MTRYDHDGDFMSPESFGLLLEDVLRDLPPKAEPFVKGLAIVVEEWPSSGPPRLADWTRDNTSAKQYAEYWALYANATTTEPQGRITLYRQAILEAGGDTAGVLRDALLRAIEGKLGVDPGALERQVGDDNFYWKADNPDEVEELVDDPLEPEPSDHLVELAESELELLTVAERDWFDEVEIAAVERPEAEGDPFRLADFPHPADEPKALVLYTDNILRRPEPPVETIRGLLREATRRAGISRA